VCGEFLSVETQTLLQRLGVDLSGLGAVPIEQVAVYSSRRSVTSALAFRALSLSRYRLDDALMRCAQKQRRQIETQRGGEVGRRRTAMDGMCCAMTARRSIAGISYWRPGSWACAASMMRATARWSA